MLFDGYEGIAGDEFQLVAAGLYEVGDVNFNLAVLQKGQYWDTSDFAARGIIRILEIPEPATAAFGILGLFCLALRRRRI